MNTPKKHHYIPQFYLKHWAHADGRVPFYRRDTDGIAKSFVATEATAFQTRLYAFERVEPAKQALVEQCFGESIESPVAPLYERLAVGPLTTLSDFTADERETWARFVMASRLRLPDVVKDLKQSAATELRRSLTEDHPDIPQDEETAAAWVERNYVGLIDNFGMMLLPDLITDPEKTAWMCNLQWWIEDLGQSNVQLLTADRPVFISADLNKSTGLLALPLSSRRIFFAASNSALKTVTAQWGVAEAARRCNRSIVAQAERWVYGIAAERFIERQWQSTIKPDGT